MTKHDVAVGTCGVIVTIAEQDRVQVFRVVFNV